MEESYRKKIYEENSNYWIVPSLKERVGIFHELNDLFKSMVNFVSDSSLERLKIIHGRPV